eukprot:Clim_evm43s230 gene=Clim_evmTU43s230
MLEFSGFGPEAFVTVRQLPTERSQPVVLISQMMTAGTRFTIPSIRGQASSMILIFEINSIRDCVVEACCEPRIRNMARHGYFVFHGASGCAPCQDCARYLGRVLAYRQGTEKLDLFQHRMKIQQDQRHLDSNLGIIHTEPAIDSAFEHYARYSGEMYPPEPQACRLESNSEVDSAISGHSALDDYQRLPRNTRHSVESWLQSHVGEEMDPPQEDVMLEAMAASKIVLTKFTAGEVARNAIQDRSRTMEDKTSELYQSIMRSMENLNILTPNSIKATAQLAVQGHTAKKMTRCGSNSSIDLESLIASMTDLAGLSSICTKNADEQDCDVKATQHVRNIRIVDRTTSMDSPSAFQAFSEYPAHVDDEVDTYLVLDYDQVLDTNHPLRESMHNNVHYDSQIDLGVMVNELKGEERRSSSTHDANETSESEFNWYVFTMAPLCQNLTTITLNETWANEAAESAEVDAVDIDATWDVFADLQLAEELELLEQECLPLIDIALLESFEFQASVVEYKQADAHEIEEIEFYAYLSIAQPMVDMLILEALVDLHTSKSLPALDPEDVTSSWMFFADMKREQEYSEYVDSMIDDCVYLLDIAMLEDLEMKILFFENEFVEADILVDHTDEDYSCIEQDFDYHSYVCTHSATCRHLIGIVMAEDAIGAWKHTRASNEDIDATWAVFATLRADADYTEYIADLIEDGSLNNFIALCHAEEYDEVLDLERFQLGENSAGILEETMIFLVNQSKEYKEQMESLLIVPANVSTVDSSGSEDEESHSPRLMPIAFASEISLADQIPAEPPGPLPTPELISSADELDSCALMAIAFGSSQINIINSSENSAAFLGVAFNAEEGSLWSVQHAPHIRDNLKADGSLDCLVGSSSVSVQGEQQTHKDSPPVPPRMGAEAAKTEDSAQAPENSPLDGC